MKGTVDSRCKTSSPPREYSLLISFFDPVDSIEFTHWLTFLFSQKGGAVLPRTGLGLIPLSV